ncbi:hypothetical protein [Brevibacterium jeotgali]|uniref:Uncharacterized protein n=1 Tax=Brevibacterium jeotgali TaxID=1262550 RepID=A0A2H1L2J9_9MICO|nr:hypothetical protein [Brevibacterium jeotgali]SMY11141.1 hypothetical protein BJEO58_00723 [Brevibacterium jeotgali]
MERADHPWYRESFAKDPWNTARQVLALRDAAISAGRAAADATPSRLSALSPQRYRIPHHRRTCSDPRATLAPGSVDDLREILTVLRELAAVSDSDTWPLGVASIELFDDFAYLPYEWQELLELLGV